MAPFYSEQKLAELYEYRGNLVRQYLNLVYRYQERNYLTDRGREYAFHGFGRRLNLLRTAIDQVFTALPPDGEGIPEEEETMKATIAIHAFWLNVVGCIDNVAWIWVYERGIKASDGAELDRKSVGLWKREVQAAMSKEFRAYVNSLKPWFEGINNFRDAIAHRIPPYIPPYGVENSKLEEHRRLEDEATAALTRGDHATYNRVRDAQRKLGDFRPVITHSFHFRRLLFSFSIVIGLGNNRAVRFESP